MIVRLFVVLLLVYMISCGKELPIFPEKSNFSIRDTFVNNTKFLLISGTIDKDTTLNNSLPYLITDVVFIDDETTCKVKSGAKFYFTNDALAALVVSRGGKMNIEGTAQEPVLMTSFQDITGNGKSGDWCGLYINGQAIINKRSDGLSSIIGKYGRLEDSTLQDDDSGKYNYLIIKYAGKSINGSSGALNINGVGHETVIKNIQLYKCLSSALKIRGGSARLKNIICSDTKGSSVEWDNGWTGFGQNWVSYYSLPTSDTITAMDVSNDFPDIKPTSNPTISNVSIIGLADNGVIRGMRFREATKGKFVNSLIADTKRAIRADISKEALESGPILFSYNVLSNNSPDYYKSTTSNADVFKLSNYQNVSEQIVLNGFIGSKKSTTYNVKQIHPWFDEVDYLGALKDEANDWTKNWIIK